MPASFAFSGEPKAYTNYVAHIHPEPYYDNLLPPPELGIGYTSTNSSESRHHLCRMPCVPLTTHIYNAKHTFQIFKSVVVPCLLQCIPCAFLSLVRGICTLSTTKLYLVHRFLEFGRGLHSSPCTGCNIILFGVFAEWCAYPLLQS